MKWTKEKLIRFESALAEDFLRGNINCPLHLCGGNEDHLLGIFDTIKEEDWVVCGHRSHYHYLLKGGQSHVLNAEIYGHRDGCCRGMGRSMHLYDRKLRFITSGIVAGGCAIATGIALSLKKKNKKKKPHVWCFVGDGAEDSGHFIEAVRFGISRLLPLTFIVEDNNRAVDSTKKERWHNHTPIIGRNIIRYEYERTYPHVGIGTHITF